jgi:hypothetical protein
VTLSGPGETFVSQSAPGQYRIGASPDRSRYKSDFESQAATFAVAEGAHVEIAPPLIVHTAAQ